MANRYSIKIGGASGTGINTIGMILSRAFKRAGLQVFANREYPSLIKGGYASYQLDVSDKDINAPVLDNDLYIAIDKHSFDILLEEISDEDIFLYDENIIRVTDEKKEILDNKNVKVYGLPLTITAKKVGGNTIMKNSVLLGALWNLFGFEQETLISALKDVFKKSEEIEQSNIKCAQAGAEFLEADNSLIKDRFELNPEFADQLSISGNEALAIGAIAGGVRAYFAYPMTPSTSILSTMAKFAEKTGILVKQAEDEITAANMTVGASHAGTRAMTATSGGGFDLMSETVSLAGITETPFVLALAQRPGPGTGLPTWTAQGDLNIALYAGHGEYPRIILAPGDPEECFELGAEAQNLAEKYQTVVIILTDKHLAEAMFMTKEFDQSAIKVDRGDTIIGDSDPEKERYELTENGISSRWLPGFAGNTYVANSDEHDEHGYSTEDSKVSIDMMDKRMKKEGEIYKDLPEPEIFGDEDADLSLITWGSTKQIAIDTLELLKAEDKSVNVLNFKYLYPLKTEKLEQFIKVAKKYYVVENNMLGQFANLIEQKLGMKIPVENRILKYDGRHFFVDELAEILKSKIDQ